MATRIQLRRDTAANWNEANPVLAYGEPGYNSTDRQIRVGDGDAAWLDLLPLGADEYQLNTRTHNDSIARLGLVGPNATESLAKFLGEQGLTITSDENGITISAFELDGRIAANENALQTSGARLDSIDGRVTALEEGGGGGPGPGPGTVLNWDYEGTAFFAAPTTGGIKIHPDGTAIYISKTNAAGDDIAQEILNEVMAGNLFSLQVPARTAGGNGDPNQYQQFSIQQNPVSQGNWFNVATQRIINANSTVPWQVGSTNLDMVVQMAPQTRFLLTDPEEQPEEIITDEDLLQHWVEYKERQGWEADYIPTQQDVNRYFNEVDQIQQETIRGQSERLTSLEEADGGPGSGNPPDPNDGIFSFDFRGTTWWPNNLKAGELWLSNNRDQVFISGTDEGGQNTTDTLDQEIDAGTQITFVQVDDPTKWAKYTATGRPVVQSKYRNIPVRQDTASGVISERAIVSMIIAKTQLVKVGFESSAMTLPEPESGTASGDHEALRSGDQELIDQLTAVTHELRKSLEHEEKQRRVLEFQLRACFEQMSKKAKTNLRGVFPESGNDPELEWDGGEM